MKAFLKKLIKNLYGLFTEYSLRRYVLTALLCVVMLALCVWQLGNDTLINIIGVMFGIIITSLLLNILRAVLTKIEDESKVTDSDKYLSKLYNTEAYRKEIVFEDDSTIGFFYDKSYSHKDSTKIVIVDEPEKKFCMDSLLENNFFSLMKAHTGSYFNNCPTVRLDDFAIQGDTLTLYTSRSTFINHMLTNRAVDFKIENFLSLRQIFESGPILTPLKESVFSNHIGINALVFLADKSVIIPHRANNSTISKNMITSSVATRLLLPDYSKRIEAKTLMIDNIRAYLHEYLLLPREAADTSRVDFLGFGRNIYEGGKPQFYYSVYVDVTKDEYARTLKASHKIKKQKIDENKKIYIARPESFCARKNKLGFKYYVGGNRYKSRFVAPERSMLCNIMHHKEKEKNDRRI